MLPAEKYRLHQSLGYQLSLTARTRERRFDDNLKSIGLTRITWCILLAVEHEGLVNPSDIAGFVGIDRTATSRALRQMEGADLVARVAGKGDRRTTTVRLTPLGQTLLAQGVPMAQANGELFESKLTPQERETLRHLLSKLREGEDAPLARL